MNHNYLEYSKKELAVKPGIVNDLSAEILNYFSDSNKSKKEWRYVVKGFEGRNENNEVIFKILFSRLREHLLNGDEINETIFPFEIFKKRLRTKWLDNDSSFYQNVSIPGTYKIENQYGTNYPIKQLKLNHPGRVITSMISILTLNIKDQHCKLVNSSNEIMTANWILDFRRIVIDIVSLFDITLNALHFKAQYYPSDNWIFDEDKFGRRFNIRFTDKFKWVNQIVNQDFSEPELVSKFMKLKELRNHLSHFDPCHFVYDIYSIAYFMNLIPQMGELLYKIRKAIKALPSSELIELIVLKKIIVITEENITPEMVIENFNYKKCNE